MITHRFLIDAIVASSAEVISTMLGAEPIAGAPTAEAVLGAQADSVIALVGIAGEWSGTGSLSCSANLACRLSGSLLMTEFAAIDDEVLDAIGEIANMIIGNIKNALETHADGPLALSIPTVVYGKNFVTRSMTKRETVAVPFTIGDDTLYVQLCIEPNDSRTRLARAVDRLATSRT